MLGFAVIAFALLVTVVLFLLIWSVAVRSVSKPKRDQRAMKPKRDENARLVLDEDGELITDPLWDDEAQDAQRTRSS